MLITAYIPGPAVAQARPRIVKKGRITGLADTGEVANYKAYAKGEIARSAPDALLDGPLGMEIVIGILKPPSWPKKRIHADTKPDADNFAKLVCDCCEGLVYVNDSRIVDLRVRKQLASKPGVVVRVWEIGQMQILQSTTRERGD